MFSIRRTTAAVVIAALLGAGLPASAAALAPDPTAAAASATVSLSRAPGNGLPQPSVSFRSRDDGRLVVDLNPNLAGTKRWRYQLQRYVRSSWTTITKDSYKGRGYFYTRGTAETFAHRAATGTYRVHVYPGQHGHTGVTTAGFAHRRPTPTASLQTITDRRLRVNVNPNLADTKRWRYELLRKVDGSWTKVTRDSYRGRGYFYTRGTAEVYTHVGVRPGRYRVRVPGGQHGHDAMTTSTHRHGAPPLKDLVLTWSGLGPLKIGASIAQAEATAMVRWNPKHCPARIYGRDIGAFETTRDYRRLSGQNPVDLNDWPPFRVDSPIRSPRVTWIDVYDPLIRTAAGIRVGDTAAPGSARGSQGPDSPRRSGPVTPPVPCARREARSFARPACHRWPDPIA